MTAPTTHVHVLGETGTAEPEFSGAYLDFTSQDPTIVSGGPGAFQARSAGSTEVAATLETIVAPGRAPVLVEE